MIFTNEDIDLIRSMAAAAQSRHIAAFSSRDPALDALLEKLDNPVNDEPAPVRKPKR